MHIARNRSTTSFLLKSPLIGQHIMRWGPEQGKSNLASLRHHSALNKEKGGTPGSAHLSPLQDGADALSVQLHIRQQPLCLSPRFLHISSEPCVSGLYRGPWVGRVMLTVVHLPRAPLPYISRPLFAACALLLPALPLNQGAPINVI